VKTAPGPGSRFAARMVPRWTSKVIGLAGDLVRTRALFREAESGITLGGFQDFFFAPPECRPALAPLHRDLTRAALTPDQVAHFFAGHGADAATSLAA
jgi:hypothetical protein